jgi:dTMP kinase
MSSRGRLIVFEGAEGAGKSTQLRLVADWLAARHGRAHHVLSVREPGGTVVGDEIRRLLLDPSSDIVPRAEAFLFMASRAQLVECEIRQALDAGDTVLVDRFFLSTYAYQGAGRGLPEPELRAANAMATNGLVPDLTLLLALSPDEGLERALARGGHDRMERAELAFHERVSRAFEAFTARAWQDAHPECGPVTLVDGAGDQQTVFARVLKTLASRWPEIFLS